jgi:hypothetical protein
MVHDKDDSYSVGHEISTSVHKSLLLDPILSQ